METFDKIKAAGKTNSDVEIKLPSGGAIVYPATFADIKALEIIQHLNTDPELKGATFAELQEILDATKFHMEFMQLLLYQKPSNRKRLRGSITNWRDLAVRKISKEGEK